MTGAAAGRRVCSVAQEPDNLPPPTSFTRPYLQLPRGAMTATEQQITWSLQRAAARLRSAAVLPFCSRDSWPEFRLTCLKVTEATRRSSACVRPQLANTCIRLSRWCTVTTTGISQNVALPVQHCWRVIHHSQIHYCCQTTFYAINGNCLLTKAVWLPFDGPIQKKCFLLTFLLF